jgi:hypothetical protein
VYACPMRNSVYINKYVAGLTFLTKYNKSANEIGDFIINDFETVLLSLFKSADKKEQIFNAAIKNFYEGFAENGDFPPPNNRLNKIIAWLYNTNLFKKELKNIITATPQTSFIHQYIRELRTRFNSTTRFTTQHYISSAKRDEFKCITREERLQYLINQIQAGLREFLVQENNQESVLTKETQRLIQLNELWSVT